MTIRSRLCAALIAAFSIGALPAHATTPYPTKPVKLIVPFSPGGASDTMARIIAERLAVNLGQPVIVDNKPGAGTMIASEAVAKSAPDGYTLGLAASSLTINPALYPKVPFDTVKDFAPVILVSSLVHVLVVRQDMPVKSVADLIKLAKSKPNGLNYGSVGNGTSTHLEMELFKSMSGTEMTHIPYKGSAPALTDMMGGQLQVMFDAAASSMPHVKSGKLRALAVTSAKRSTLLPDLPTVAESGLPGYEAMPWLGILAPAGTSPEIVNRLNAEVTKVLAQPEVKEKFAGLGLEIIGGTPKQFADFIKADLVKWAKVVKDSGAKVD
ncbi:tripartite tricarboxylate transporter substrate binding protein [Noviherbaspirillum cavernae]|uniref:Tripartite tricarboxylate transporter substrate binding protein n=1 Tax=Noviherbaspirillum cavernae TaxID=2320862 RepID=A0A418X2T5_9BURK|nr:tripartite tricarboxylate transporter substrate binding protein [Noviherbaspirillum cavernae]RJG06788.1 tripartite tricarboxylate transporter substrate binding protein [Noviherbaspirillum cavernae]